jgi:hypothetical protein
MEIARHRTLNHRTREGHMRSPHQPTVGRTDPYPLPESYMLVLEDTNGRHPAGAPARHIQAAILLLLAACVLLMVIDSSPDHRTAARFPAPAAQTVQEHRGGISGAALNAVTTCEQDRVCAEGGS